MTDHTELKLAAEAASQGRWNQDGFDVQNDDINDYRVARCNRLADAKFIAAANPATLLALIAQIERDELALRAFSSVAEAAVAERDQLRAQVAGLRTGYEAYERVNAELKAEVEKLRKLAVELRGSAECHNVHHCKAEQHELGDSCKVLARIDAALGQGEQS